MEPLKKERICVVGSGMAGLVAAYTLQRDRSSRFWVEVIEGYVSSSLDTYPAQTNTTQHHGLARSGYSYSSPQYDALNNGSTPPRIDVPMRVFSGEFYKSVWALIDHLGIVADKRRFLFAYSKDEEWPYYVHPSNLHRFPIIWTPFRNLSSNLLAVLNILPLLASYIWLTIACHFFPPKVRGRKGITETETLEEYTDRIHLPEFLLNDYILPLFSSVASCSHEKFRKFPAFYVTDYKRLTQGATHCTVPNMAEVERRLSAGLNVRLNTMVKKVERQTQGLAVTISDRATNIEKTEFFDQIILAISPKAIDQVFEPTRWLVSQLKSTDVGVVIHSDQRAIEHLKSSNPPATKPGSSKWKLNPTAELRWMGDSEVLTVRTGASDNGKVHITEATHVHLSGALITVWPKHADVDTDWSSSESTADSTACKVHEVTFCRVAATVGSSYALEEALGSRGGGSSRWVRGDSKRWRNGDDGVWIAGGTTITIITTTKTLVLWNAAAAAAALAAVPVGQNPRLIVGQQQLASYVHGAPGRIALALPGVDMDFVGGTISADQIGMHRPFYINAILI